MRITRDMTLAAQTSEYAASLALRAAGNGFWRVKCANWWNCGSNETHVAVIDEYYPTPLDAAADDVSWHALLCQRCYDHAPEWKGSKALLKREKVSTVKRRKCAFADPCGNSTVMFINAFGGRQYLCITHVSIHANYTQVFADVENGELRDMTEHALMFYQDAIGPRIRGEKSARS